MTASDESHLFSLAELTRRQRPSESEAPPVSDADCIDFARPPGDYARATPVLLVAPLLPIGTPDTAFNDAGVDNRAAGRRLGMLHLALAVCAGLFGLAVLITWWTSTAGESPTALPPRTSVPAVLAPTPAPAASSRSIDDGVTSAASASAPAEPPARPFETASPPVPPAAKRRATPPRARSHERHAATPGLAQGQRPSPKTTKPAKSSAAGDKCSHCASHDLACNIKCRAGG